MASEALATTFDAPTEPRYNQIRSHLGNRDRSHQRAMAVCGTPYGGSDEPTLEESLDEAYRRALIARKDAWARRKRIPPFVQKLTSLLEDSRNANLIRWSDDGESFTVLDEDTFAKTLIPELFKHNNYASFVRQLNMYGFHKKVRLSDNSMRTKEAKNRMVSEFFHKYFKRGHSLLLWLIQKPHAMVDQGDTIGEGHSFPKTDSVGSLDGEEALALRDDLSPPNRQSQSPGDTLHLEVGRELDVIRRQQLAATKTAHAVEQGNNHLRALVATLHGQQAHQGNTVNAVIAFLTNVYNRSVQGHGGAHGPDGSSSVPPRARGVPKRANSHAHRSILQGPLLRNNVRGQISRSSDVCVPLGSPYHTQGATTSQSDHSDKRPERTGRGNAANAESSEKGRYGELEESAFGRWPSGRSEILDDQVNRPAAPFARVCEGEASYRISDMYQASNQGILVKPDILTKQKSIDSITLTTPPKQAVDSIHLGDSLPGIGSRITLQAAPYDSIGHSVEFPKLPDLCSCLEAAGARPFDCKQQLSEQCVSDYQASKASQPFHTGMDATLEDNLFGFLEYPADLS
ncbi:heat shock transcription factor (hsf) [Aspergillus lentulus]|nr:heat shock transcription factor (hsf) [Aspergillus lentulus]GFG18016.1 heat shock transcription factor (hsf) [Aspergillus lentulus]